MGGIVTNIWQRVDGGAIPACQTALLHVLCCPVVPQANEVFKRGLWVQARSKYEKVRGEI